jgi:hypothetical protein
MPAAGSLRADVTGHSRNGLVCGNTHRVEHARRQFTSRANKKAAPKSGFFVS